MKKTLALLSLFIAFSLCAQNPVGNWVGALHLTSQSKLNLIFDIEKNGDVYATQLISVDQGNAVVEANKTTVEGDQLCISFASMDAEYNATITADALDGTFTQHGQKFALTLTRNAMNEVDKPNRTQTPTEPFPYTEEEVEFTNPEAAIEQAIALNKALFGVIRESSQNDATVTEKLKEILRANMPATVSAETAEAEINKAITQITTPWLYYFIKYEPTVAIKGTKCPVLAINGSLDCQVDADKNLAKIEQALKEGGNKNVRIVKLEGLNHLMQPATTGDVSEYATIETTLDESALNLMTEWIIQTTDEK